MIRWISIKANYLVNCFLPLDNPGAEEACWRIASVVSGRNAGPVDQVAAAFQEHGPEIAHALRDSCGVGCGACTVDYEGCELWCFWSVAVIADAKFDRQRDFRDLHIRNRRTDS